MGLEGEILVDRLDRRTPEPRWERHQVGQLVGVALGEGVGAMVDVGRIELVVEALGPGPPLTIVWPREAAPAQLCDQTTDLKMTAILGISGLYHDSAAALVLDGEIVAAAQEERFSRRKHDASFPTRAIQHCLESAGVEPSELEYVGFYEKPLLKFERLLETYLQYAPRGYASFARAMPLWLKQKQFITRRIRQELGGVPRNRIVFTEHHESHAASAFFPSPFEEAAILTLDGVGEWAIM